MATLDDAAAQHVVRTLRVLELLAEGPQTQAHIARRLEVHRRTARRLLGRLVQEGYAVPTERGRFVAYAATPRLTVLGRQVADGLDLAAIARRHIAEFSDLAGVRAGFFAVLEEGSVHLAHVGELSEGEGAAPLPRSGPLHATAAGKVFLSANDGLLAEVLSRELLAYTSRTLITRGDLLLELATVRAQGYAVEDGEHRTGARAVASGVKNHAGQTVAALGATAAQASTIADLGIVVRGAALEFSREIGAAVE
jgi:DNA-binding IclR family transcriptional regulator